MQRLQQQQQQQPLQRQAIRQLPQSAALGVQGGYSVQGFAQAVEQLCANSIDAGARSVSVLFDTLQLTATVTDDGAGQDRLQAAADALALAVREGSLGRLAVERSDGESLLAPDSPVAATLERAGFRPTPRGLRLRA